MSEFIEITLSCGSIDEARKIARLLVKEKLVACAQIIPWIESIYTWDRQLETTQESQVKLKTRKEHFEAIQALVLANSSYQVPEIVYHTIEGGNSQYLDWLKESTFCQK
jgi:periplasmic divalent cation tolerance protein